jgi:ribose 5-phosphate isomerase B
MRIIVGADHAGFPLKGRVVDALRSWGHEVEDVGTHTGEPVDFPDVARLVCDPVRKGEADRGVMVCGTGIGACMAANKIPGVRAAVAWNEETARLARQHNDANVLCVGARFIDSDLAARIIRAFLETDFEGGRHERRVQQIAELERRERV